MEKQEVLCSIATYSLLQVQSPVSVRISRIVVFADDPHRIGNPNLAVVLRDA